MVKNYLTVAIRSLVRDRFYALINISGLAVGVAFSILAFLYVQEEWTFDGFHKNGDRIYRIYSHAPDHIGSSSSSMLGPALQTAFDDGVTPVRVHNRTATLTVADVTIREREAFVDPNFLSVFTFPSVEGDVSSALTDRHSIVLTESHARRLFGEARPVGKTVSCEIRRTSIDLVVTAVLKDPPRNSTFRFGCLLPFELSPQAADPWNYSNIETYVLFDSDSRRSAVASALPQMSKTWLGNEYRKTFRLQPLANIHLDPEIGGGSASHPAYAWILAGIALLVITVASVNFTTLSVARLASRSREVGLRKVLGAQRRQVSAQFLSESLLISALALLAGIGLSWLLLPTFNAMTGRAFTFSDGSLPRSILFLGLITATIGLMSGSYPALIVAGFQPSAALRDRLRLGDTGLLGRVLVVVQFGLSIFMVIGALVGSRQLDYLRSKPLGVRVEQIVTVRTFGFSEEGTRKEALYKEALATNANIVSVAGIGHYLTNSMQSWTNIKAPGGEEVKVQSIAVDYGLIETMDMQLLSGKSLSRQRATTAGSREVVVNEALVKQLGLTDPVGSFLDWGTSPPLVVGVVGDFHFRSLHHSIEPALLEARSSHFNQFMIRIRPENVPETIAFSKEAYERIHPEGTFRYAFFDDEVDKQYREEERWTRIVRYGALIAVFIAAIGAFGLTALTVGQRTKELGIRKVLGAGLHHLSILLGREIFSQVLIAGVMAWVAAYYAAGVWLRNFPYRIDLDADLFALGSLLTLAAVTVAISTHIVRAARENPVNALRAE